MTDKARSRLRSTLLRTPSDLKLTSSIYQAPNLSPNSAHLAHNVRSPQPKKPLHPLLISYLKFIPTLIASIISGAALISVLTTIQPEQVENLWLPEIYAPLLLLVGLTLFFSGSFFFLNSRRGLLLAQLVMTLLLLHFKEVTLTWQLILAIGVFFGILDLMGTLFLSLTHHRFARHSTHH